MIDAVKYRKLLEAMQILGMKMSQEELKRQELSGDMEVQNEAD